METNTKTRERITVWCTQALVIASVLLSVVGFITHGKGLAQASVLTFVLILFAWLLTESIEKFISLKNQKNWWRAGVMVPLMVLLLGVEVHLVHFGIGWLFPEFSESAHYVIGAGFSLFMLYAKATYGFTPEPELESTSTVDDEIPDYNLVAALEAASGNLGDPHTDLPKTPSLKLAKAN